jgi:hypothetical protein
MPDGTKAGFTVEDTPRETMDGDRGAEKCELDVLANPDMSVLRLGRRVPPRFLLDTLGPAWAAGRRCG